MSFDLDLRPRRREVVAVRKDSDSSTQLINQDGLLNAPSLDNFVQSVKLSACNVSYAVVAIMGPQSSGKSTLLNNLFSTNFDMMDAANGRKQMTKGIWMAQAVDFDPLTIVLDIEGNDGKERGHGHPFERQAALFALALADIVLINMWCHDIGREAGANKPLLRTVFQAMTQSFSPCKTTLLFVIRDKTKTPISFLEADLKDDLEKIWEEVKEPEGSKNVALSAYFNVEVISLYNFEDKEEQFIAEVAELRKRFHNSIAPGGIAGDREGRVPGSAFSLIVQSIWETIKANKNLDLPSHKVMVSNVKCEEIAEDKLRHLRSNENWLAMKLEAKSRPVPNFGKQTSSILAYYLSEYDKEAKYFDEGVRNAKRLQFEKQMLEDVRHTYLDLLGHHLAQATAKFKTQLDMLLAKGEGFAASVRDCKQSCLLDFDKQCQDVAVDQAVHWDATKVREKLTRNIETHSSILRENKLSGIVASLQKNLSRDLERAVIQAMETMLLEGPRGESWPWIRAILIAETDTAASEFRTFVSGFELDDSICNQKLQSLAEYGRDRVEKRAREEGARVFTHMKNRFTSAFSFDKDSMPRQWTASENIKDITHNARSESLKIMSDLAIIRLEEIPDNIEETLFSCLMNESTQNPAFGGVLEDPLANNAWEKVSPAITIIKPSECKSYWRRLVQECGPSIFQAQQTQTANQARDAAVAAAEDAKKELAARVEAADAALRSEAEAATAVARSEAALAVARADAAVQAAKAAAELASANAEIAIAKARATVAEDEIARRDSKWCKMS